MSAISVSPEQLKQQSKVYLQAKQGIESEIQKVNKMNDTIANEWKGQAFQAYLTQYGELKQSVNKFEALLESINKQLDSYANTMAARDAEDAKSFGFK
ncbi:MAG: WXG100 family type VII secretion target [Lachnospiraceae bacterium]|jgi:WXG100 family type VII secretion target|nr:WXG100 family type VII secretion target [Lachnospiraceae bacterium]